MRTRLWLWVPRGTRPTSDGAAPSRASAATPRRPWHSAPPGCWTKVRPLICSCQVRWQYTSFQDFFSFVGGHSCRPGPPIPAACQDAARCVCLCMTEAALSACRIQNWRGRAEQESARGAGCILSNIGHTNVWDKQHYHSLFGDPAPRSEM